MTEIFSRKNIIIAAVIILVVLAAVFFRSQMVPSSVVLQVPFTPQAPTDNWSRNEDCEEASVTMANAYLNGQTQDQMSADDAQNAINQLKNWENINAGYNMNTGADATTHMAQGAFGILVTPILNYSEQDLKKALAEKHVVLLPLNAKILNPAKYNDNGPLYHMIVVRGYNEKEFIVNDPGTNSGDGNTYTFDTLKKASADWDQAAKAMDPNRKVALILSK